MISKNIESYILVKNEDHFFNSDYHESLWLRSGDSKFGFSYKACRVVLLFLSVICNVDSYLRSSKPKSFVRVSPLLLLRRLFHQGFRSQLTSIVFILMSIHILCNVYHQYKYDFLKARINKANSLINMTLEDLIGNVSHRDSGPGPIRNQWLENLIKSQILLHKEANILHKIGAPHIGLAFISECLYLTCWFIAMSIYMLPQVYMLVRGRMCYYFSRNFLVYEFETNHFDGLINLEVDNYLASSLNHIHALQDSLEKNLSNLDVHIETSSFNDDAICRSPNLDRIFQQHKTRQMIMLSQYLDQQVVYWNSRKSLRPYNRSPKWIQSWTRLLFPFFLGSLTYGLIIGLVMGHLLLSGMEEATIKSPTVVELLILLELFLLALMIMLAATLHVSIFLFTCLDQLKLVKKLNDVAGQAITWSRSQVNQLDRNVAIGPIFTVFREQINSQLSYVILQFKIFEAQHKELKDPFGFTLITGLMIMFAYPMVARFHLPYFETYSNNDSHRTLMCLSFFIVPPFTVCVISICTHYHRCVRLYQAMSRYLAHIIDAENHLESLDSATYLPDFDRAYGMQIFSTHLVSLLRKLVSHPENLQREFAVESIGLNFNYANMLRVYFWFGIIVISTITYDGKLKGKADYPLMTKSMVTLLEDPFGLI